MPSNIEIKARVADMEKLKKLAERLADGPATLIRQTDTFFNAPNCRLKLRQLQDAPSQLIYYSRSDQAGPKFSDYHISYTETPGELKETLSRALGTRGCVEKERHLYLVGQTRVHLDNVTGLGTFMELEVVMHEGQSVEEGQAIAEQLMDKLNIDRDHLIEGAYLDLLLAQREGAGDRDINEVKAATNGVKAVADEVKSVPTNSVENGVVEASS